jgi:two-component system alkaline phosphatase synthesis response regulator PhoP
VKTMSESKTVLIIDDDSDFVRAIQALLETSGFRVRSAVNGRDGLELAKTIEPDLVLLDVMMSERTEGFFVLQEIRRIPALSQTPVIVLSSIYADLPAFRVDPEAGWLPANLFLAKPVEPAHLLAEVVRLTSESPSPANTIAAGGRQ